MKTKEEVIKGVYKNNAKSIHADVNGWMKYGQHHPDEFEFEKDEIERYGNMDLWRPKSLQGIETNNGWISIQSEKDLPSEQIRCNFIHNEIEYYGIFRFSPYLGGEPQFYAVVNVFEKPRLFTSGVTHYAPIEKKQPPLHK